MKYILLLLIAASGYCADTTWTLNPYTSFNARKPATDTVPHDWFVEGGIELKSDTTWKEGGFVFEASKERDNGEDYYEYLARVGFMYGHVEAHEDSEHLIYTKSIAAYYPVSFLRFGSIATKSMDVVEWDLYIQAKTDWLYAEISFFEEIERDYIGLSPYYTLEYKFEGITTIKMPIGLSAKAYWEPDEKSEVVLKDWEIGYKIGLTL